MGEVESSSLDRRSWGEESSTPWISWGEESNTPWSSWGEESRTPWISWCGEESRYCGSELRLELTEELPREWQREWECGEEEFVLTEFSFYFLYFFAGHPYY